VADYKAQKEAKEERIVRGGGEESIGKNRHGEVGTWSLTLDGKYYFLNKIRWFPSVSNFF
jgi:hypothetical protein